MKIRELIEKLNKEDQEAEIKVFFGCGCCMDYLEEFEIQVTNYYGEKFLTLE